MERDTFDRAASDLLGPVRLQRHVPLAPFTTFRVGGPAEWLAEVRTVDELRELADLARTSGIPVTVLGGGSNVLVADSGIRGLVVRLHVSDVDQPATDLVRAGASLTINGLVRWTIGRGLAGLEEWAGTPGTVGGAVYGNAHWRGRNIGDLLRTVTLMTPAGEIHQVRAEDMGFAYDTSRVQTTKEIVLTVECVVAAGDAAVLRARARESLAYRKRTQPLALSSAGCVFRNPDPALDVLPEGIPASAGALIDRAGLKGRRIGGACVSVTHGNFIVNDGGATAAEIRRLIEDVRAAVLARFGIALRDEIVFLGEF